MDTEQIQISTPTLDNSLTVFFLILQVKHTSTISSNYSTQLFTH